MRTLIAALVCLIGCTGDAPDSRQVDAFVESFRDAGPNAHEGPYETNVKPIDPTLSDAGPPIVDAGPDANR